MILEKKVGVIQMITGFLDPALMTFKMLCLNMDQKINPATGLVPGQLTTQMGINLDNVAKFQDLDPTSLKKKFILTQVALSEKI